MAGFKSGLFNAKHRKRMGPALWLYGWLHTIADSRTGKLPWARDVLEREQRAVLRLSHSTFVEHWTRLHVQEYLSSSGDGWIIKNYGSFRTFLDKWYEEGAENRQSGVGKPTDVENSTGSRRKPDAVSEIRHAYRQDNRSVDVVEFSDLELREQQHQTYRALVQIGVMDTVARELSSTRDPEQVLGWVDYASGAQDLRNPAGLVVKSLREGIPPPHREEAGRSRYISGEYAAYIEH